MTDFDIAFVEGDLQREVEQVPLAHLSIEIGHLYSEDFERGIEHLQSIFARSHDWAEAARTSLTKHVARPRVSQCFLIDDYFNPFGTPREVVPMVLEAAKRANVTLDYLARESACAVAGDVPVAEVVLGSLVSDPAPGTNGSRPPLQESGWLCNGQRSPNSSESPRQAMSGHDAWLPPTENGARNHSIFMDVELWSQDGEDRLWSCAFLATAWQLLRLGALRIGSEAPIKPEKMPSQLPDRWDALPPIVQINRDAASFSAYCTSTIISGRYLPVEHAVRTVMGQVAVLPAVSQQIVIRAEKEGVLLPDEVVDRMSYVFLGT